MPTIRRKRKNRRTLSYVDWMDLVIGGPYTPGERTRLRPLWESHREQLMASVNPGTRPAAFWEFEVEKKDRPGEPADPRKPGYVPDELQIDRLKRLGLLTPAEKALLADLEKTVFTPFQAPEPPARKKKASKPKLRPRPKPQVAAKAARSKDSRPSPAPEAAKEEAQKPKNEVWFYPAGGSGGSTNPLDEPWPEPFEAGEPD